MTSKDDLALLHLTMPTGAEGFEGLEKFVRDGNAEVRKLLYDECDIMLECRYCRNIFRSIINFVSHKRSYCRAAHTTVVPMAAYVDEDVSKPTETATKKRIGQMSVLSKRVDHVLVPVGDHPDMLALAALPRIMKEAPVTTFEEGIQKVIGRLPSKMAIRQPQEADTVCLTMPQDNSSKYKEMSLRSRKVQNTDKIQNRDFTSAEIKIIEFMEKQDVRCGDFVQLQCDHPACAYVRPFHSLQALAYHCSLRHTRVTINDKGEERWPCLICFRPMRSLEGVYAHMERLHKGVKEVHLRKRKEEDRATKGKKLSHPPRSRSLSMEGSIRQKGEKDGEENEDETEEEEDQEEEMIIEEEQSRGRRRSRRGDMSGMQQLQPVTAPPRLSSGGRSDDESGDYEEEPPVLQLADADSPREVDSDSQTPPPVRKNRRGRRVPERISPEEEDYEDEDEEEEEEEVEEEEIKLEEPEDDAAEEQPVHELKWNSAESCVAWLVNRVCEDMGEEKKEKPRKNGGAEKRAMMEESSSPAESLPVLQPCASKKRGRPKKSEVEERMKQQQQQPAAKLGRPPKKNGSGSIDSGEKPPKRQYVKRKVRGSTEGSQSVEGKELSEDAAAAAVFTSGARPARDRKRPRWMMDDDEDGATAHAAAVVAAGRDADLTDLTMGDDTEEEEEGATTSTAAAAAEEKAREEQEMVLVPTEMSTTPANSPAKKAKKDSDNEVLLFTPRSGKAVQDRIRADASSSRKRKQNLGKFADESDEITIVSVTDPMNGPKRSDLTSVPVYLSEHQQRIFFAGLIKNTENAGGKDFYECSYCQVKLPNVRDGRRHMVAHLRVMRLRCGLCGAGSFFCIDMRNHLQLRGCDQLAKAPAHMIRPGTPCMTKEHADELTFVAHSSSPGRALFTSGKIVSILSNSPYLPDPVIEEKILGPTRVPPRTSSPRKPAHKLVMALKEADWKNGQPQQPQQQRPAEDPSAMPVLQPALDDSLLQPQQLLQRSSQHEETQQLMVVPQPSTSFSAAASSKALRQIGEPTNAREAPPATAPNAAAAAPPPPPHHSAARALIFTPPPRPINLARFVVPAQSRQQPQQPPRAPETTPTSAS